MTAQDYPITTPYGQVKGYPLNNGFHQGVDYGCPTGTPVVVNGVAIGLSGATGYVQGAHLHLGKWLAGAVQNPGNGGFKFNSAVVTEVHAADDSNNGKYVRIQGDGASWVYLHLSEIKVSVGQELKEIAMTNITPEALQDFENWKAWGVKVQAALKNSGILDEINSDVSLLEANLKDKVAWKAQGLADELKLKQLASPVILVAGIYQVK